jgi:hypothetical protein
MERLHGASEDGHRQNTKTKKVKLRVIKTVVFSLLIVMTIGGRKLCAEPAAPSEYQVKAAFLYNFAKFVEWPPPAFVAADSPITIGILGNNPFGEVLEATIRNKTINGRQLRVKEITSLKDPALKNCHILFISQSERKHLEETLEALKGTSILTVSEIEQFTRAGGMVNFVMEGNKVRFDINDGAAARNGLKISSKLLSLTKRSESAK